MDNEIRDNLKDRTFDILGFLWVFFSLGSARGLLLAIIYFSLLFVPSVSVDGAASLNGYTLLGGISSGGSALYIALAILVIFMMALAALILVRALIMIFDDLNNEGFLSSAASVVFSWIFAGAALAVMTLTVLLCTADPAYKECYSLSAGSVIVALLMFFGAVMSILFHNI